MAVGTANSPLCRITWTEVVVPPPPLPDSTRTGQHFAFQEDDPIELRFGLKFEPSFWTSCDSAQFFAMFAVFNDDIMQSANPRQGDALNLPGAKSTEQWIGLSFGQAGQVAGRGLFQFRPQIFFLRQADDFHDVPGEFAIAPSDHTFLCEMGGSNYTYPFE